MMDPRRQKRLGPAPIASFEKSFEDTTAITPASASSLTFSVHAAEAAVATTTIQCSTNSINLGQTQGVEYVGKTFNGNGEGSSDDAKEMVSFFFI